MRNRVVALTVLFLLLAVLGADAQRSTVVNALATFLGASNAITEVSSTNPLPVSVTGALKPDTACFDTANQDIGLGRSAANVLKITNCAATSYVTIGSSGILFPTDNALDIGASAATRPRNMFLAGQLVGSGVIIGLRYNGAGNNGVIVLGNTAGTSSVTAQTTGTPTCSSNCGTSPSVVGSDSAGMVTMGASGVPASGWVVTFNGTWSAAPHCNVTPALATMVVGKLPIAVVTSTTTMTVTTNGTAPATSDKYQYQCLLGA